MRPEGVEPPNADLGACPLGEGLYISCMGDTALVPTVVQDKRRREARRRPQRASHGREHGRGKDDAIRIIAERAGDLGRATAHSDQHDLWGDPAHVGHRRADIGTSPGSGAAQPEELRAIAYRINRPSGQTQPRNELRTGYALCLTSRS
jgi:hypothetical protein